MFAAAIRKRRIQNRSYSNWRWHLDEVFVRINGETHYLWRAVDHEGEVLEVFATKRRDRRAALKFLKRAMRRYGRPVCIVTDRLGSYGAAMKAIGVLGRQKCGRWLNNPAENSHQPFRRREGPMAKFRDIKALQKFASVHASIHNHFHQDRHLNHRAIFKQNARSLWPSGVSLRPKSSDSGRFWRPVRIRLTAP
jgi:putative transposase